MGREGKGLILLAEDDPDQSDVLSEFLEAEGYGVLVATNALEVMEKLSSLPDVVLLDLNGVSSPAVFSALRKLPMRPALVLISADCRLSDVAGQVGSDAFLEKPYDLGELLLTVEAVLEARQIAQTAMGSSTYV
jgi:DNA-binding response OmpR family regulator